MPSRGENSLALLKWPPETGRREGILMGEKASRRTGHENAMFKSGRLQPPQTFKHDRISSFSINESRGATRLQRRARLHKHYLPATIFESWQTEASISGIRQALGFQKPRNRCLQKSSAGPSSILHPIFSPLPQFAAKVASAVPDNDPDALPERDTNRMARRAPTRPHEPLTTNIKAVHASVPAEPDAGHSFPPPVARYAPGVVMRHRPPAQCQALALRLNRRRWGHWRQGTKAAKIRPRAALRLPLGSVLAKTPWRAMGPRAACDGARHESRRGRASCVFALL